MGFAIIITASVLKPSDDPTSEPEEQIQDNEMRESDDELDEPDLEEVEFTGEEPEGEDENND